MARRPTRFTPLGLTALAALALFAAAPRAEAEGLASQTPTQTYRGSIESVRHVLAPYRTEMDMIGFVGDLPVHCIEVPGDIDICSWRLSKTEQGWFPLAKALRTGDRLNLICAFPSDDSPRAENSCSVHAQRSNRRYLRALIETDKGKGRPASYGPPDRRKLRVQAQKILAASRTAFELSTLVGDAPTTCRLKKTRAYCSWLTANDTYGHGTLVLIVDTQFSDKIRLTCMLPVDGSPRAPDSCTAKSWHY